MKTLKSSLDQEVWSWLHDSQDFIKTSGFETIAEYLLNDLEATEGYGDYLENADEGYERNLDGSCTPICDDNEATQDEKQSVIDYIKDNYDVSIADYFND